MYYYLLLAHSWNRWLVLTFLAIVLVRSLRGLAARATWTAGDDQFGSWLVITTHIQFVLGLVLYFVSPVVQSALSTMPAAMKNADLRFWAVEHLVANVIAVALITIGRSRAKRLEAHIRKHRTMLLFVGLALLLMLWSIPFASRPWFRY